MSRIGRERGWPPTTRQQFDASRAPHGSLLVGSAQEVIDKILYERELFHHDRFLAQMTVGPVPHEKVMRSIELLGTVVSPAIRQGDWRLSISSTRRGVVPQRGAAAQSTQTD